MGKLSDMASGPSPLARMIGDLDDRPHKPTTVPGREDRIALWCLTQTEADTAKVATFKYLRATLKLSDMDMAYDPSIYEDNFAIEVLATALRDADEPRNCWARDSRDLRDRLTPKELTALFAEYESWSDERNPQRQIVDLEKEVDELVSLVGKDPAAARTRLRQYDGPSPRRLLPTLVDRLARLMGAPSSDASSPSDSDSSSTDS